MSLLAVNSIFCIFEFNFKIRKMKKWSIFPTIFFFSLFFCTLKYGNMIRISNMSFCRFCCKNEKIDWPKCARTVLTYLTLFDNRTESFTAFNEMRLRDKEL